MAVPGRSSDLLALSACAEHAEKRASSGGAQQAEADLWTFFWIAACTGHAEERLTSVLKTKSFAISKDVNEVGRKLSENSVCHLDSVSSLCEMM